jgi:hypothetical protein
MPRHTRHINARGRLQPSVVARFPYPELGQAPGCLERRHVAECRQGKLRGTAHHTVGSDKVVDCCEFFGAGHAGTRYQPAARKASFWSQVGCRELLLAVVNRQKPLTPAVTILRLRSALLCTWVELKYLILLW